MSDINDILDAVNDLGDVGVSDEIRDICAEYEKAKSARLRAKAKEDEMKAAIMAFMEDSGFDSFVMHGRRYGTQTKTYWGIAQGQTPEEREANVERAKAWLDQEAPDLNIPASNNIQRALNEWLDRHPNEEAPDFLSKSERVSLTNRQG
jgi:hypothetical protein